MKYTSYTKLEDIQNIYDYIIAWGGGALLFANFWPTHLPVDFIVDGKGKDAGKSFRGVEIKRAEELSKIKGRILIIIYTIYENQVLQQIERCNCNADTIIFSLLRIGENLPLRSCAKNSEDMLLGSLLGYLGIKDLTYLEVGVCHPIMRNNTYLLREHMEWMGGSCRGVLAEANPLCWNLIEEYRPHDKLLKCGIGKIEEMQTLYVFPDLLGLTTFLETQAMEKIRAGVECREERIKMRNINAILKENFDCVPDLLALDAEGMDYTILEAWNHEIYPFRIVVAELWASVDTSIDSLMDEKGYSLYARTVENGIWIRKEDKAYILEKLM